MKRTPLARKTPMKRGKGLSRGKGLQRSGKLRQRSPKRPKAALWELRHLEAVKRLPCRACGRSGPSDAHHCFHDRATRYDGKKAPHRETIPLCKMCHQDGPEAIHRIKRTWRKKHGKDWSHVPAVMMAIYGVKKPTVAQIKAHWGV